MKTILTLLLFMISSPIFGQYFAEPGSKWSYKIWVSFLVGLPDYIETFEVSQKMEFNGKLASVIAFDSHHCNSSVNADIVDYLAYEDGIVYMHNWDQNDWMVLYNFNAVAGDKWEIPVTEYCTIEIEIDSVGYEIIDGASLKVLYVAGNNGNEFPGTKIYERLGGNYYLFPNQFHSSCGNTCDGSSVSSGLRCYEDSLIAYKSIEEPEDCEVLISSNNEILNSNDFIVYPNPVSGKLYFESQHEIDNEIIKILIYNTNGQIVHSMEEKIESSIDLNYLRSGLYSLITIWDNGKVAVNQFVKL